VSIKIKKLSFIGRLGEKKEQEKNITGQGLTILEKKKTV
jgi:hypothetical protein